MTSPISEDLDRQIIMTHERFVRVMEERLSTMRLETKERYFATLSALVAKLADPRKPLRDVLHETMAETAAVLLQELGS